MLCLGTTGYLDTLMPGALSLEELQDRYDDGDSARAAEVAAAPGGCAVGRPDGGETAGQEPQPHVSGATAAATDAALLEDPGDSGVDDGHDDDADLELQDYLELHDGAESAALRPQAAAPRCSLLPRDMHRLRWWMMRGATVRLDRGMVVKSEVLMGMAATADERHGGLGAQSGLGQVGRRPNQQLRRGASQSASRALQPTSNSSQVHVRPAGTTNTCTRM